jgi:hypothetical protein
LPNEVETARSWIVFPKTREQRIKVRAERAADAFELSGIALRSVDLGMERRSG